MAARRNIRNMFSSMTGYRKKIVAFLITVALGIGVLFVCSARSATDGTESKNSNSQSRSLFADDPNFTGKTSYNSGSGELFFRAMLAVLFVVVLGATAIYVSKKLLPKITNLPGKEIRVVETVYLGPRKAVHLLEIGDRRFLIGSTNENITKLADLTSVFTDLSNQEMDNIENINERQVY